MKNTLLLFFAVLVAFTATSQNPTTVRALKFLNGNSTIAGTSNGTQYYDPTDNKFYFYQGSSTRFNLHSNGTVNQIPVTNSGGTDFVYSATFTRDATNNSMFAINSLTNTNSGTQNNNFTFGISHSWLGTGNIRWLWQTGESNIVNASSTGVIHNSYSEGVSNTLLNSSTRNMFNSQIRGSNNILRLVPGASTNMGAATIIGGRDVILENAGVSMGGGYHSMATKPGGISFGFVDTYDGTTHTGTVPYVLSDGKHAINMSTNTSAQTTGYGALSDYSAIFAGLDGNIPSAATGSVLIGVNNFVARTDTYQTYVQNFNIITKATRNDTLSNVLVGDWSVSGGPIKRVYAGRLASDIPVKTVTTTYTATLDDNFIIADATGGSFTITLPPVASAYDGKRGHEYIIKIISATGTITIEGDGSEQVEFALNQTVTGQGAIMRVQGNGTAWYLTGQ